MERRDAKQGSVLRRWLGGQIKTIYEKRMLPLSREVALVCPGLPIPDPKSERDAWIIAIAIDAELILVSRNEGDFATMGVKLINLFDEQVD
jgi:toxin FitB